MARAFEDSIDSIIEFRPLSKKEMGSILIVMGQDQKHLHLVYPTEYQVFKFKKKLFSFKLK